MNSYPYPGGGILVSNYAMVILTNCVIKNCFAHQDSSKKQPGSGGGIALWGNSNVTLINCKILDNTADDDGGGMFIEGADVHYTIRNTLIFGNKAGRSGGGIFTASLYAYIIDSTFSSNHFFNAPPPDGQLGKDIVASSPPNIVNSSFLTYSANSIHGTVGKCVSQLCQHSFPEIERFGIDCINKKNNMGMICKPCSPGMYLPKDSLYSGCLPCLPGKATTGYGKKSCDHCIAGKYTMETGAIICKNCLSGQYTKSPSSTSCHDVPPGTHPIHCLNDKSADACGDIKPCTRGHYCKEKGTTPLPCDPGSYSNNTGAPVCIKCAKGSFASEKGAITCKSCVLGKHAALAGSKSCTTCAGGKSTYALGGIECDKCTVGKAGKNGICSLCPQNDGKYQDEIGQTSCKDCKNGKISVGTTCILCPAGGDSTNGLKCTACIDGYYAIGGSECKICPSGKWAKLDIKTSQKSKYNKTTSSGCNDCFAGFYGDELGKYKQNDACKECPEGRFSSSIGADNLNLCNKCPLGTSNNVKSANNSNACKPCANGKVANITGSITCFSCFDGFAATSGVECDKCTVGKAGKNGICSLCPQNDGKYQDEIGQTSCKDCKNGKISVGTTCILCPAGGDSTNGLKCTACIDGYYAIGGSECKICPSGKWAKLDIKTSQKSKYNKTTSSGCNDCFAGFYGDELGKYKQNDACKECPEGRFSSSIGADNLNLCNKCPLGTSNNVKSANNSNACKPCANGKVANITGSITCFSCFDGSIPAGGMKTANTQVGATLCQKCSKGTYQSKNKCHPCDRGKSQVTLGSKKCVKCNLGKYANNTGLPQCIECPPGRATSIMNSKNCDPCQKGRYTRISGLSNCVKCRPGYTTFTSGSVKCSPCQLGRAGMDGLCNACNGTNDHADKRGLKTCKHCPLGKTPDSRHVLCNKLSTKGKGPNITSLSMTPKNKYKLHVEWTIAPATTFTDETPKNIIIVPVNYDTDKEDLTAITTVKYVKGKNSADTNSLKESIFKQSYYIKVFFEYKNSQSTNTTSKSLLPSWQTTLTCNKNSVGQYLHNPGTNMKKWECKYCPPFASCEGPITWDNVTAVAGHWQLKKSNHVEAKNSFYKCLNPKACLGAPNVKPAKCNSYAGYLEDSSNKLCATCAKGYARGSGKGSCERCSKVFNTVLFILQLVIGIALNIVLIKMSISNRRIIKLSDGVKKIAINYLQFATLASHLDIPWTDSLKGLFQIQDAGLGITNAKFSLNCVLGDAWFPWDVFQLQLTTTLSSPILFIPILYVLVTKGFHGGRKEFISATTLFLYLKYKNIVKTLLTLLTCTEEIDRQKYIQIDLKQRCFDYGFFVWSLAILGLLVYVLGLPIISVFVLKNKKLDEEENRLKFGILYDGYAEKTWWWDIVVKARQIAVMLISAFMDGEQQVLCALFVIALSLFITAIFRPFYDERLLQIELIAIGICFMTFFLGGMMLADSKCSEFAHGSSGWCVYASCFEEIEVGDYLFLKSKLLPKKDSKNSDIIKEKRVKVVTKNMTHITVRNDNTCVNYDRKDIDNGRIKYIHEKSPFDRSRRVIMTYFIGFVIMPCYFYCGWQLFDILIYKFEHFENMKLVFKVIMGLGIIACFLRGFFYFLLWLPSFQFKCPSQLYIWLLEIPTMCTLICAFLFFHYIPSDVIVSDDYANLRIEEIDTAINILEMERVNLENDEFDLYRTLIYSTSYDISEMTDSEIAKSQFIKCFSNNMEDRINLTDKRVNRPSYLRQKTRERIR
eukprot:g3259.t1